MKNLNEIMMAVAIVLLMAAVVAIELGAVTLGFVMAIVALVDVPAIGYAVKEW